MTSIPRIQGRNSNRAENSVSFTRAGYSPSLGGSKRAHASRGLRASHPAPYNPNERKSPSEDPSVTCRTDSAVNDAIEVLEAEAAAIRNVISHLDETFSEAVGILLNCKGRVAVSGMGKAGLVGEKISATLASTGTPSFFLHPAEALHGDLGRLRPEDVILALSNSGETAEMVRLIDPVKAIGTRMIAVTGRPESRLARYADFHLFIGDPGEACPMGLAPTSTTTAMIALGDALAMTVLKRRGFGPEDYARYHPGGSLGRKLMKVQEIMRRGDRCTTVLPDTSTHGTLLAMNATKGRPGAACVIDGESRLLGFVTDGDLVRAMGQGADFLNRPVRDIMISAPKSVRPDDLVSEALHLLKEHKIDQLPVVAEDGKLVGLLDIQDLIETSAV